ncbi:SGNH/GDSL hydrolase family protein [Flagellimonas algicola]|uniref:SGNH/GDSL hydrolase family protein n=1 Tax=Flagellimonas algicola TaxID=2583815 RepID=A0ABY2WGW0_9FLAO|nr:SGNH/GDSL hydrolase family protein [Allomuricauda algicola]TMU50798.1 SGNH/GDSL hydrolase family protein [Allomuricauda algicola]
MLHIHNRTHRFLILLALGFSLCGAAQNDSITFLALGDSYTEGTSELRVNSWPFQLSSQLRKKKIPIKDPKVIALVGWTTSDLLEAVASENPKPNYDLVSLCIGVNNQFRGQSFEKFQQEFSELLEKSIRLAKGNPKNVIVLSIPDYSVTPYARFKDTPKIVKELEAYNRYIEKEANARNTSFIEITKISRNARVNPDMLTQDSLHPSKKMYKAWVKKISKEFKFQKP